MTRTNIRWSNPSVVKFATNGDPVDLIMRVAQEVVFDAMEQGWTGPPFDPFELCQLRGLAVTPRADIQDAQIQATSEDRLVIEYNPNRPIGRIRYSICHEIAHTFFPDCSAAIRCRGNEHDTSGTGWQLELLCNIAAAELLMPIGSFRSLGEEIRIGIDRVLELRKQYQVSTEALLLRLVRLVNEPIAVFAASRRVEGEVPNTFKLDYMVPSKLWQRMPRRGGAILKSEMFQQCFAVGFTAKGMVQFPGDEVTYEAECVGLPPFAGSVTPRVVGLVRSASAEVNPNKITYLVGDALRPQSQSPKLIAHVVNDQTPNWGGAFAKQVARMPASPQASFRKWWHANPDNRRLGAVHICDVEHDSWVASMVAQRGYGPSDSPRIRYSALDTALGTVAEFCRSRDAGVHIPRIGCGQAGGSWSVVEELIERRLISKGIDVIVYDLPKGRAGKCVIERNSAKRLTR